jgi:hypothetical protein
MGSSNKYKYGCERLSLNKKKRPLEDERSVRGATSFRLTLIKNSLCETKGIKASLTLSGTA